MTGPVPTFAIATIEIGTLRLTDVAQIAARVRGADLPIAEHWVWVPAADAISAKVVK
jgi:hypothetical protein